MNAKQAAAKRNRIERLRQSCHDSLDSMIEQGATNDVADTMRKRIDQLAERADQLIAKQAQQRG